MNNFNQMEANIKNLHYGHGGNENILSKEFGEKLIEEYRNKINELNSYLKENFTYLLCIGTKRIIYYDNSKRIGEFEEKKVDCYLRCSDIEFVIYEDILKLNLIQIVCDSINTLKKISTQKINYLFSESSVAHLAKFFKNNIFELFYANADREFDDIGNKISEPGKKIEINQDGEKLILANKLKTITKLPVVYEVNDYVEVENIQVTNFLNDQLTLLCAGKSGSDTFNGLKITFNIDTFFASLKIYNEKFYFEGAR
jgi:hypothetical protein